MLETLTRWLTDGEGSAQVAIRLNNASTYSPYILRAADQAGLVVSPSERPREMIVYPWTSIFGITDRFE